MYTLHTEMVPTAWAAGFRNLIIPGGFIFVSGMPYDHGRNSAVAQFLQGPWEYLFSLDSDVIPPRDAILRLMSHNKPIISGVYHRRSPPHGLPVMMRKRQWIQEYPANALIEVDMVGAGCMLVHRSVWEKIPPQRPGSPPKWFDWRADLRGAGVVPDDTCLSEDFSLNLHWQRHGLKIYVDTGVQCRHAGLAQATYGRMEPLDATPVT